MRAYRIHWGLEVMTVPGVRISSRVLSSGMSAPPLESESESKSAAAAAAAAGDR